LLQSLYFSSLEKNLRDVPVFSAFKLAPWAKNLTFQGLDHSADEMTKDRSYFVFLEAMEKPGCPICHLILEDSRGYLDSLMYERVLDVPTRLDLMESFGFCSWHTWQIPTLPAICNPTVGFSTFASDLLRKFDILAHATIKRDHEKWPWQRWLKKIFGKVRLSSRMKGKSCPACVHVAQSEHYYLKELTGFIQDDHFLSAYETSGGICLPHFFSLEQSFSNQANFPVLLKLQLSKVRSLRNTIDEFIRKQDHRFRDEITATEAKAWRMAMEFLSGQPGVFNNEMRSDLLSNHRLDGMAADGNFKSASWFDRISVGDLISSH